ncbi:MAG: hypothetical protein M1508_00635 [Nitrospirae bacterium]|nr:hypothetical protein [Nitrospirota bacterium]MCL5422943.1 hypothetical protein [Nitrospirota bacterium]
MAKESITVLGREITYEIKDVDINSLEYDPENPRINRIVSRIPSNKVTQEFIEMELLKLDSTKDLIKDLEVNKGVVDEVYVLGNKVIEGNRRLCAYRRLCKKYEKNPDNRKRWQSIKARILQKDVTEEEISYILVTFHIKGKTPWDAYEKAAYVYRMIKKLNKKPDEISKHLGMQKKTIESMLNAYETMSAKYLRNSYESRLDSGTKDEVKKFSYFDAFYRQKDLVKRAQETPAFLDDFVEWVKEDRFKKAQNVRDLPKILGNKKACKAFYDNGPEEAFDEAMHILYEHKPEKVDRFYKKIREFRDLINDAEALKIKVEIEDNKNKKSELQQCYKELKRFCKEIGLEI